MGETVKMGATGGLPYVEWLPTLEMDTSRVLVPDGAGGLVWAAVPGFQLKTRLLITGPIAAGTTFDTTAAGVNYAHQGDATGLDASQPEFEAADTIRILLNGVEQDKETEITWISANEFQFPGMPVDAGDIITIYN